MRESIVKPWSNVEDDALGQGFDGALAAEESSRSRAAEGATGPAGGLHTRLKGWWAELRITMPWAFLPLGVASAWIILDLLLGGASQGILSWQDAVGVLALVGLAIVILVLARVTRRNAIRNMLASLGQGASSTGEWAEQGPIDLEWRAIWQGVEVHAAGVERRCEELGEANKQLMLELTLTDTQRRQAASLINALSDPVLAVDAFEQLILANPASEKLLDFSFQANQRRPIRDVIRDERLLRMIQQAREADARSADRKGEVEIAKRQFAIGLTPLAVGRGQSEDDERHGVVVTFRDVTREREVSMKKSEFVAQVAHELRTPLSSIRAYVEMLVDGEARDEKTQKEFYEIIQTSADRLGRLIDNMLNISRIEAGTVRINKEPMALSMIVKEAVDMIRPQAEAKKIVLSDELTPVMYRVMADRDLMYQAVLNLVSNAVKYTPEGGQVRVCMKPQEEKGTMLVEVSDTGAGIPKEDQPKVFEKFFRVEANKKLAKGTGLGLNLVKKVVETIHGGELTLRSEDGKGSTFGIILPLMSESA